MTLKNKYLEAYQAAVQDGIREMWSQAKENGQRVAGLARKRAQGAEVQFKRRFARAQRVAKSRLEKFRTDFVAAAGIASKSQVDQLRRRIAILTKRLDGLMGRRPAPKELKAG